MMNVFTFWEGKMPAYIRLCMETWKLPYKILNYDNLQEYTDIDVEKLKRFTLPHIADCVRVHVLRDHGGYWLDADTIMISGKLPETELVGDPKGRTSSAGLLYSEPHSEMFEEWAEYQDWIIYGEETPTFWGTFVNSFSDPYAKEHKEIRIHPIEKYWPETYMITDGVPRYEKYRRFYFEQGYRLADIRPADLLMLHNSWTPEWYKRLSATDVLAGSCTMSNILREMLQ